MRCLFHTRIPSPVLFVGLMIDDVVTLSGTRKGFTHGSVMEARYNYPRAVCADPRTPGAYWVSDNTSIRYCHGERVELLSGGQEAGCDEGVGRDSDAGRAARFNGIFGMVYVKASKHLIVSDVWNSRIRSVSVDSGDTKLVAGDGTSDSKDGRGYQSRIKCPRNIVFDRTATAADPETAVFIASSERIRRLDLTTAHMTTVPIKFSDRQIRSFEPYGIDCLSNGHLIVSCVTSQMIYLINAVSGTIQHLAGAVTKSEFQRGAEPREPSDLSWPSALAIASNQHSVYICDRFNDRILRLTLPLPTNFDKLRYV